MELQRHAGRETSRDAGLLHVCDECSCELVYPTDWRRAGTDLWTVDLRCPNCEAFASGTYHCDELDPFDERLDEGTQTLLASLRRLSRENLEEDIGRFAAALAADAILPMDF